MFSFRNHFPHRIFAVRQHFDCILMDFPQYNGLICQNFTIKNARFFKFVELTKIRIKTHYAGLTFGR